MAIAHANPGMPVDLRAGEEAPSEARTTALVKNDTFEAIRLVLRAGEELPPHKVTSKFTLHCIEGRVAVELPDQALELRSHEWIFIDGDVPHALRAIEDASLLLTIMLPAADQSED